MQSFTNLVSILDIFINHIIPTISINLFMMYLVYKGGYKPALLYRIITTLPLLTISIFPDYNPIIITLFNVFVPLFSYLVIRNNLNIKDNALPKRMINKSSPRTWIITFVVVILLVLFTLGAFPITPFVIITSSMSPNINPGDIVVVKKSNIREIKVDDVIQYKMKDYTIVHRVIKIDYNKKEILTKGDNNNKIDTPTDETNLMGKVIFKIPYVGYPTYMFRKLLGKYDIENGD